MGLHDDADVDYGERRAGPELLTIIYKKIKTNVGRSLSFKCSELHYQLIENKRL